MSWSTSILKGGGTLHKAFSAFLSLLLVVTLLPTVSTSAYAQDSDGITATISGDYTVSVGGTYQLAEGQGGTITIETDEAVTFIGNGVTIDESGNVAGTASAFCFDATSVNNGNGGANITLQDVYISHTTSNNILNFAGEDNYLYFSGTNIIDYNINAASAAAIHVPQGAELTIDGTGTLYFYKRAQGAGIGGDSGEANGTINFGNSTDFTGPTIFAKGSQQGALIGAGANLNSGTLGSINFYGGTFNLIANARGAVIGGGAGGSVMSGTTVSIYQGASININVDWTGAAIGGGGTNSGNTADGGTLYVWGGSLRVFIDENATSYWDVSSYGVNDIAITAQKFNNVEEKEEVVLLTIDTSTLGTEASSFTVLVDGETFYEGGLHEYDFVNQDAEKTAQYTITDTPSNWVPMEVQDKNLYLYVTKENHTITVNDEVYTATWDESTESFTVVDPSSSSSSDSGFEGSGTEEDPYIIDTLSDLEALRNAVNDGKDYNDTYFVMTSDIDMSETYSASTGTSWTPIGISSSIYFAGIFDGGGYTIGGLYINASSDYQGLFGYVSGATIKNLVVSGEVTSSASHVGGVVGYGADSPTLINLGNEATVTGSGSASARVGGIIGQVADATIIACYNKGDISGRSVVGGIVGRGSSTNIYSCYNVGNVTSTRTTYAAPYVGGISGYNATLYNCYNFGTVSAPYYSSTSNYISALVAQTLSGNASNLNYWYEGSASNAAYSDSNSSAQSMSQTEMEADSFVSTLNSGVVSGYGNSEGGTWVSASTAGLTSEQQTTPALYWEVGADASDECAHSYNDDGFCESCGAYNPDAESYTVRTAANLAAIAEAVNAGDTLEGKTVTLADDIDLVSYEDWTPIGDADNAFAGTFDGAGYAVENLTITDCTGGYHGLFGNNAGTISNATVTGTIGTSDAKITTGADGIGGIVGYNSGTVTGVTANVTIYVDNEDIYGVGGVVGHNADEGLVSQSSNIADIEGTTAVGGIVGNNYGTVAECFNTGDITGNGGGRDGIGGIVGRSGDKNSTYQTLIYACYNTGTISNPSGRWFGGIAGFADSGVTLYDCYNIGTIATGYSTQWNPIIGGVDSAYSTVSNNYSLEGLSAGDTSANTQPVTIGTITSEADFKSSDMISKLNGSGTYFVMDTEGINGGFPVLAWQVGSEGGTDYGTELASWEIGAENAEDVIATLYESGTLVISGSGDTETYSGTSSVPWYSNYRTQITSVTFEEGVEPTSLAYWFSGCSNLTSVSTLPDSVESLFFTFSDCTSLEVAPVIPSSVTDMGYTFNGCTSLVKAPEIPVGVTSLSNTFTSCSSLVEAPEIPNTVTDLSFTFYNCISLEEAPEIPSSVTDMSWTFRGCTLLTVAPEIPEGVTILYGTFHSCTSLEEAPLIPSTVTDMFTTFYNCTSLTSLPDGFSFPENVTRTTNAFGFATSYRPSENIVTYCSASDYEALAEAYDWESSYRTLTTREVDAIELTDSMVADIADQTYTGEAIEPGVTIADGDYMLVEGTDYELTYADNTDVGTATVTVTGIGNYTGTLEITFEIVCAHSYNADGFCDECGAYDPDAESYTVRTAANLAAIAEAVNAGDTLEGKTVTLANDVSLADYEAWTPIGGESTQYDLDLNSQADLDAALEEHFIIYDSAGASYVRSSEKNGVFDSNRTYYYLEGASFDGIFDGAGYTISDLCVNTDSGYAGLFGAAGGTVKNVTVAGSVTTTTSQDFVGGIVGKLNAGGLISGCISQVTVTATSAYNVGGIVGFVGEPGEMVSDDNPMAVVENCLNQGDVTGYSRKGGIAGRNAGTIRYCVNEGTVTSSVGSRNGTGGIVGMNGVNNTASDAGIVEYCYNRGYVDSAGGYWSGGIAGFQNSASTTTNCYNAGLLRTAATATGTLYSWINPIVGQNEGTVSTCLWLNEDTGDNTANYVGRDATGVGNSGGTSSDIEGVTREYLQSADAVTFLGSDAFALPAEGMNDGFPILAWQVVATDLSDCTVADIADQTYTGAAIEPGVSITDGDYTLVEGTDYELTYAENTDVGTATVTVTGIGNYTGTLEITFEIVCTHSYNDDGFCDTCGAYNPDAESYTVRTAANLAAIAEAVNAGDDLENKTVTLADDIDLVSYEDWTPIGDADNAFAGTFDGAGYAVENLTITDCTGGYHGLFGNNAGTVSNVTVTGTIGASDAKITTGADGIGGIVGYNSGTVTGVTANVTIYVNNENIYGVGGVVGHNADEGLVSKSSNIADIEGTTAVGGIVGNNYGTVAECFNTGDITGNGGGKDGVGGIVGRSGDKNSTYQTLIYACYNTGTISNQTASGSLGRWHGGIVGFADSGVTLYDCYDIGQIVAGYSWNWNPIIGHVDSAYSTVENNYSLEGLNAGDTTASTMGVTIGIVTSEDDFKSADMISKLNASGTYYVMDTEGINGGFPVLAWQMGITYYDVTYTDENEEEQTIQMAGGSTLTIDGTEQTITESVTVSVTGDPDPGYSKVGYLMTEDDEGNVTLTRTSTGLITYSITYDLDGGVNNTSNPDSYTVESSTIALQAPTKDGYLFTGWVDAEGNAVTEITQGSTGDVVLYATWQAEDGDEPTDPVDPEGDEPDEGEGDEGETGEGEGDEGDGADEPVDPAANPVILTYSGETRYETAAMIVTQEIELADSAFEGIIVANGDDEHFADSLAASGLSGLLNYPIVLTSGDTLSEYAEDVIEEIYAANGPLDIIVLGDEYSISEDVRTQLKAYAYGDLVELQGADRYATAQAIYEYGATIGDGWNTEYTIITTGENFPDALSVASYAAYAKVRVVLVNGTQGSLPASTAAEIADSENIVILGDSNAVSSGIENDLISIFGKDKVTRLAGDDRYETSAKVASWALGQGMSLESAGFATGEKPADALASSTLLGMTGSVLLLVSDDSSYNTEALELLANADAVSAINIFGDEYSVSEETIASITSALGWIEYDIK